MWKKVLVLVSLAVSLGISAQWMYTHYVVQQQTVTMVTLPAAATLSPEEKAFLEEAGKTIELSKPQGHMLQLSQ